MTLEDNKKLVSDSWQAVTQGNWPAFESIYDENVAYHGSGPTELKGRDGVVGMAKGYMTAFPNMRIEVEMLVAEDDLVVSRARASGTNSGALMGMPPTGKSATLFIHNICRIAGGKIVEEWEVFDNLDFMRQLGVIPAEQ